jgi:hypothetical protein
MKAQSIGVIDISSRQYMVSCYMMRAIVASSN